MRLLPCPTCPWRVDQDASVIPNYVHEKACGLMNTVGEHDDFRTIMACHGSLEGQEKPCIGYVAMAGDTNLNVRILAALGKVPWPQEALEACQQAGIELHPDYPTVLAKLARTQRLEKPCKSKSNRTTRRTRRSGNAS